MKKTLTLIHFLSLSVYSFAQVSMGGEPLSAKVQFIEEQEIQSVRLLAPLSEITTQEDVRNEAEGNPPRYAVHIPVGLNMDNSGTWTELKGGDRIWRLRLETPNALATLLLYDQFLLPSKSSLYIYNDSRTAVIGGFSSHNNTDGGSYATQLVSGQACTLEYFEPAAVRGKGGISISYLGHAYRFAHPPNFNARGGNSGPCQVDVNCSEGGTWQDEKRGVLGMSIASNFGSGWCTASLVNNTSLDCTPYILSAMHCTESSSAANFGQYVFYFNYESTGCAAGTVSQNQSITGCVFRADSDDGGGASGSDFVLLEATATIPGAYNAYYNGWNVQNAGSQSGVSIHHPSGDRKKISTYGSQLTTTGWGIGNTHWSADWVGTANGHGVTEGGSSGSPLFDNLGRIVGTLTGGGSFCNQVPNTSPDAYGKMSYHWQSNPGDDLRDWLDPGNTGQLTLAGTYPPCTPANTHDAGISLISQPSGSVCSNSITPEVTLTNYGSATLTNVTVNFNVDGSAETPFNWTGNLASNQSISFSLPTITVTAGPHTFNAFTTSPNNQSDENNSNNAASSSFNVTISDTYVSLIINTDGFGSETTWQLTLDGGGTVANGGPYTDFEMIQVTQDLCVQTGECYTFTIFDEFGDGICCYTGTMNPNYEDGSYSLGNANGISIWTGSEFGTSEVVNFCVPSTAGDCDTLYDPFSSNANGFALYANADGGYIAGSNSFGDLAKAQEFAAPTQPVEITGVICWIAAKADEGASVTANLYALDGAGTNLSGAVNNAPGTVIASGSLNIERIDTTRFLNFIEFAAPVVVTNGFAVGLDFSGFGNDDEIGIATNLDGDANGTELAWEQWSDGNWFTMNQSWNAASDGDFDLGIFPVICPETVTGITDIEGLFNLYPNPSNGQFVIVNPTGINGQLDIYNATGQLIRSRATGGAVALNIDLQNETAGIYLLRISTDKGVWNTSVVLANR